MNYKYVSIYLIIAMIVVTAFTWNNPDWQIEVPAPYFFTIIFILALIDFGAFEGYFKSKSPGYLSDIDDRNSHASFHHKDIIDYIDPVFSTKTNPTARFTCAVLNGLDYGIVSVKGRGPIQIFPSPYLRKKADGYTNDGEFEIWKYEELTPAMEEVVNKFTKVKEGAKKNKIKIWVSTVSNLDGSNIKSNIDCNEAVKASQKERNAVEDDYDRALDYVRGKKKLTKTGRKDKTTYDTDEEE